MRIVIDMQGAQTASRFRGIGRYSMAMAKAIARNRGPHEVILVLNGLLDQGIEVIRKEISGLLPEQNVLVWMAPGPVNTSDPRNEWREQAAQYLREAFLASLQPDVVYLSSLFEGYVDNAVTSVHRFDAKTLVCPTVYDFIPLINPEQYLSPNPAYAKYYERKVEEMRKAGLFLAISESSRREAIELLEIPPATVVNMAAACDDIFVPMETQTASSRSLLQKWGISKPFILYTGGADHRKNLARLIEAFASLPTQVRSNHQLLFAGKLSEIEIAHLRHIAKGHAVSEDDLKLTGFISDNELVAAYNLCDLFVFPSWHEGFGLPPLEAMSCGAAVIAANTSSLPEVVAMEAALFDPFNVKSITEKMHQALTDFSFREALLANGKRQAAKFSWDASARIAIKAFESSIRDRQASLPMIRTLPEQENLHYPPLLQAVSGALKAHAVTEEQDIADVAACIAHNEVSAQLCPRSQLLPSRLDWRLEGPFDSSYSLALVNRELARALVGLGHRIALHSSEGPGDFSANSEFLQANPDLALMHQQVNDMPTSQAHILSRFMYPPRVQDMECNFNALHCYGWEESQFPSAWVDAFNQRLQGITVMSSHVQKVLIDSGVRVPIAITGLGVDHWERVIPDPGFEVAAKAFRFLHVSSCFPRKGAQSLLRAYGHAFRAHDDVTLVIKTFENPHNEICRWLEEARAGDAQFPDVQILLGDYSDAQLKSLYEQCHVLVAPSKAEGFGLPLAEAMLSGLAVVATGWSGQLDFCTDETAWLIDYEFVRAESHFDLSDSVWAEPDVRHLARTLREVHAAPEQLRQQRAHAGRQRLMAAYTWPQVAERSVDAMRLWASLGTRLSPRIGWVTSWNTRCGIASYSEHLLRYMSKDIRVLASEADQLTKNDEASVTRCWAQGDGDSLQALAVAIEAEKIDVLVVQFNYGFFDFTALARLLEAQMDAGKKVVVEMHATTDPLPEHGKRLSDLVPALHHCSRVLVHSLADMNRLKRLGLVHNVSLFPLGILDHEPTAEKSKGRRPFVVASYGFFLPHKGLSELVDAMLLLQAQGFPVILKMMNAEYPAPQSREAIEQTRLQIAAAQAQDVIELMTQYQDDAQSLEQLSDADLIVYPYQETGESSSAAVRHGLASGKPVAVTPLGIFDDVLDAVHLLPGLLPEQMAKGIEALLLKIEENDASVIEKGQAAAHWCSTHRHSRLGDRMENLLTALHGQ